MFLLACLLLRQREIKFRLCTLLRRTSVGWQLTFVLLRIYFKIVRPKVLTAVTMKNAVFWDIKTQFVPHRRHAMSPLQIPAG
jgi:hypothetical protein